jgi:hypothetical protein
VPISKELRRNLLERGFKVKVLGRDNVTNGRVCSWVMSNNCSYGATKRSTSANIDYVGLFISFNSRRIAEVLT